MAPLELMGGRGSGEMTQVEPYHYRIRAVGEARIPGGQSVRTVIVVEGRGDPLGPVWRRTRWRYARPDELEVPGP